MWSSWRHPLQHGYPLRGAWRTWGSWAPDAPTWKWWVSKVAQKRWGGRFHLVVSWHGGTPKSSISMGFSILIIFRYAHWWKSPFVGSFRINDDEWDDEWDYSLKKYFVLLFFRRNWRFKRRKPSELGLFTFFLFLKVAWVYPDKIHQPSQRPEKELFQVIPAIGVHPINRIGSCLLLGFPQQAGKSLKRIELMACLYLYL